MNLVNRKSREINRKDEVRDCVGGLRFFQYPRCGFKGCGEECRAESGGSLSSTLMVGERNNVNSSDVISASEAPDLGLDR